jgi:hypothetical protein
VKPITFHPDADAEVTEAAQFYEARSPGLGSGLLEEVQRSLAQVVTRPEAHQKIGRRGRRKPHGGFPTTWNMRLTQIEFESWHLPTRSKVHSTDDNG